MKRRLLLVTLLSLTASAGSAFAQPEPGDAGIFFDPAGETTRTFQVPFVSFEAYMVMFDMPIQAWVVWFGLNLPPEVALLSVERSPLAIYPVFTFQPASWVLTAASCFPSDQTVWVMRFELFLLADAQDLPICLVPCWGPTPCNGVGDPGPGYRSQDSCGLDDRIEFRFGVAENGLGVYPDGCAVVNPTQPEAPIATEQVSWGAVKARF